MIGSLMSARWLRAKSFWGGSALVLVVAAAAVVWRWHAAASDAPKSAALEYRTKLVKEIAPESTDESLKNLADFNDVGWVAGGMGDTLVPGSYRWGQLSPHLNRVRKILQEQGAKPEKLIPKLETAFSDSLEGFDVAWKEMQAATNREFKEPNAYHRKATIAPATAYMLGELKSYRSLPLLARGYLRKERLPISRVYLFYVMHTLALDHPRENLSPAAKQALDAYLAAAKDVPPPKLKSVPAWNAKFEETDFRVTMAKQNIGIDKEPQIKLHFYPGSLIAMDDFFTNEPNPKVKAWFAKLKQFIDAAYPDGPGK